MNETEQDAYLTAASHLLGLPIRPEHREDVLAAFGVIMTQAKMIMDFPLPDHIEVAPRFTP